MRYEMMSRFPDIRVFKMWNQPIGPHPISMFEADVSTPKQYWDVRKWIEANHGALTVLVHPHTGDFKRDHFELAYWIKGARDIKLKKDF